MSEEPDARDPAIPIAAEWWRRLVALLLDGVVVVLPAVLLVFGAGATIGSFTTECDPITNRCGPSDETGPATAVLLLVCYMIVIPAYHTICNGRGQTLGKHALKIRVCDKDTGEAIGYGRALARWLVTGVFWSLAYVPGLLDGLWPLWDPAHQAWHDKVVNSMVVKVPTARSLAPPTA